MNKKKNLHILKFPANIVEAERQVEAILFAAEEPLDLESIQTRLKAKANVPKILKSLENQYKNRGINLICIANKWSFRTPSNLSKLMNLQKSTQKKLSKAAAETLAKRANEKKINKVYLDRGHYKYHGRIKLFAEALRKNGLNF